MRFSSPSQGQETSFERGYDQKEGYDRLLGYGALDKGSLQGLSN